MQMDVLPPPLLRAGTPLADGEAAGLASSAPDPSTAASATRVVLEVDQLSLWYGTSRALKQVSLTIPEKRVTAFIGPSGCGKSTLLRCFNRLNDLVDGVRITGDITLDGQSLYDPRRDVNELRRRVGMVFQKSNPFPKSIY